MSDLGGFEDRYAEALGTFLLVDDEAGLERAYLLGREAIADGLGLVELAAIHARVLARHITTPGAQETSSSVFRSAQFLAEALAPFEMALRGFREANQALKNTASTLEQRVIDRTSELGAAERALREQARILTSVVESVSDGIVVADRTGAFVVYNSAARRLIGVAGTIPASEMPAKFGAFHPDTLTPFSTEELPLVRAMRGEQTKAVPLFLRNEEVPNGIHVSVIGSPLRDEAGNVIGGVEVLRDVSEAMRAEQALRRTEEQLRQAQKMDAIGQLAGGVAHDFNNMLCVILALSNLVLNDLEPGAPFTRDIEEIRNAGMRAAELTRQLLMFSRQQVLEPQVIDLGAVLGSMQMMLQRLIGADVDLICRTAPVLGKIRADRGSIEQVLLNLAVNARDAMPTGGKLTIATEDVVLDQSFAQHDFGTMAGPHVMLAVSDTGAGMDRDTQARIFEPFFTTKEKGKGTGLGLSTVFGIVKQSGGSISVFSEVGHGTTFKIYFPRVDAQPAASPVAQANGNLHGSETILLVDDDTHVRTVACRVLRRYGYHVIEAQSADDALAWSEGHAHTIHLLVTDVVMPNMSGPELARRLGAGRPDMKILCMSGYTDDSIVRHGVLQPRIAYLQKPITPETLARKVREVLDAQRD